MYLPPKLPNELLSSISTPQRLTTSVIETTPRGDVVINVYTRLLKERIIWLGEAITNDVANAVMAQLLYLDSDAPGEDIHIYLNSPGGSIAAGLGIYDTMQFIKSEIVTICAGSCYSMATVLLCAGAPGRRYALPNSIIHQHPSAGGMEGYAPDVEIKAKHLLDIERRTNLIMAKHTGQPYEKIASDFLRDRYFSAEEAKEYGFIDEILYKSPD